MYDPMTVAFEIKYPWYKYKPGTNGWFPKGYRASFITIWHVDPESDNSDDSCDWFNHKKKLTKELIEVRGFVMHLETLLDNRPHYPDSQEHLAWQPVNQYLHKLFHQPSRTHWWQIHPRWHIWHWHFQIHPLQAFKRWAFSRCEGCGKGFEFGYSVVTTQWNNKGPQWFRSEKKVYHERCCPPCNTPTNSNAAQESGANSAGLDEPFTMNFTPQ